MSDLSEHFQAGRLTTEELDERIGRALAARTWGELGELMADLPAPGAPAAASGTQPRPLSGPAAPPLITPLIGLGIAAVVLVTVAHLGWGLIWMVLPVLFIARRSICHPGPSGR